jgi:MFS family permease
MPTRAGESELLDLVGTAPLGERHRWFWALSVGGTLLAGFSMYVLGVSVPLLRDGLRLDPAAIGLVGAALMLGGVVGSAVGGPAADRFGRRALMLLDMALVFLGGILSMLADGAPVLFLGQLVVGAGIGIDFPVSAAFVSEIMPARSRRRMMVATIAWQPVGMALGAVIALPLLASATGEQVWRTLLGAEGAIGLVFLVLRLSLLESPHWLMAHGRNAAAADEIARLVPAQADRIAQLGAALGGAVDGALAPGAAPVHGLSRLWSPAYRTKTLLVSLPWFLMDIATYGVGLFTPTILMAMAPAAGEPPTLLAREYTDARGSAILNVFLLAGSIASLWTVPGVGRIRMQTIGFAGMAAGMLVLMGASHVVAVVCGFALFNLLMNSGPNATTFTLAPELFPTELRASAGGLASSIAKLGAAFGVFLLPILREHFGITAVLGLVFVVSLAGGLATWVLGSEVEG